MHYVPDDKDIGPICAHLNNTVQNPQNRNSANINENKIKDLLCEIKENNCRRRSTTICNQVPVSKLKPKSKTEIAAEQKKEEEALKHVKKDKGCQEETRSKKARHTNQIAWSRAVQRRGTDSFTQNRGILLITVLRNLLRQHSKPTEIIPAIRCHRDLHYNNLHTCL